MHYGAHFQQVIPDNGSVPGLIHSLSAHTRLLKSPLGACEANAIPKEKSRRTGMNSGLPGESCRTGEFYGLGKTVMRRQGLTTSPPGVYARIRQA